MHAARAAQSEPSQAKNAFEVGKQHFDFLSPLLGSEVKLRGVALAGEVSNALVFLAVDGADFRVGTALGLQCTS